MDEHLGVGGGLEQAAAAHQGAAQHVGVGQVAVMRHREAAELEIGVQRLHVAQHGVAGGGVAVVADRAGCRAARRSRAASLKLSPTRPRPRCEWKCSPSKLTMPVASWPRCCSACRPSAVTAAASDAFQTPKTPHSSCSLSSSAGRVGHARQLASAGLLIASWAGRWPGPAAAAAADRRPWSRVRAGGAQRRGR